MLRLVEGIGVLGVAVEEVQPFGIDLLDQRLRNRVVADDAEAGSMQRIREERRCCGVLVGDGGDAIPAGRRIDRIHAWCLRMVIV